MKDAKHLYNFLILSFLNNIKKACLDSIFPSKCLICGRLFPSISKVDKKNFISLLQRKQRCNLSNNEQSEYIKIKELFLLLIAPSVCFSCVKDFRPMESLCYTGDSMNKSDGDCEPSNHGDYKSGKIYSVGYYEGVLKKLIQLLKYNGKIQISRSLNLLLFAVFMKYWGDTDKIDAVVPIPLYYKRFRSRGFNQSFLLIKDWDILYKMFKQTDNELYIAKDLIIRQRQTQSQVGLAKDKRIKNIKGAFFPSKNAIIKNKKILLVDDVYTTGATVQECANVLLKHGAVSVDVLVLARA